MRGEKNRSYETHRTYVADLDPLRAALAVVDRLRAAQQSHVDGLLADGLTPSTPVEGVHPVARLVALDNLQQDLSALIADLDHFTDAG